MSVVVDTHKDGKTLLSYKEKYFMTNNLPRASTLVKIWAIFNSLI